jgi:TPR repeat protein
MPAVCRKVLLAACIVIVTALPVRADNPTFADLLARAKAQAAAGHRWMPPGDNMTETVVSMMDLIPTATSQQLSELSVLLASEKAPASPPEPIRPPPAETRTAAAVPPPAIARSTVDTALATPDRPVAKPAVPIPSRPALRALEMFARGEVAERQGDVSGARRFYASAAAQGHAEAARNLGRLYDPAYLQQTVVGGIDPDPALARHWYERAIALGDAQATPLLDALSMR